MVAEVSLVNDDSHKTWMTSTLAMMISLCTPNPKRLGTSRRGICLVLPELFGLVRMSRGLRNLLASWGWNRNSAWCMPFVTRISCYVECPLSSYLRAIVVAKGGEPSRSHNLLYLASKAGVATTEKQNGRLERIGYSVKRSEMSIARVAYRSLERASRADGKVPNLTEYWEEHYAV